jgi:hypothetical protein
MFEIVVDSECRIHSCAGPFFGGCNDQIAAENHEYVQQIYNGLYKDLKFLLYGEAGSTTVSGGYLITDNGYKSCWTYQAPIKNACTDKETVYTKRLESVRKDVERTFGILKARFRYLHGYVGHHSSEIIGDAFKTCCIIHNLLLGQM